MMALSEKINLKLMSNEIILIWATDSGECQIEFQHMWNIFHLLQNKVSFWNSDETSLERNYAIYM
jgi:hypothetical protein